MKMTMTMTMKVIKRLVEDLILIILKYKPDDFLMLAS